MPTWFGSPGSPGALPEDRRGTSGAPFPTPGEAKAVIQEQICFHLLLLQPPC